MKCADNKICRIKFLRHYLSFLFNKIITISASNPVQSNKLAGKRTKDSLDDLLTV